MARFRKKYESRHSRQKGSLRYIVALLLLCAMIFLIWTSEFENSSAFQWLTATDQSPQETLAPEGVVVVEEGYQYAWHPSSERLLWTSYMLKAREKEDTNIYGNMTIQCRDADTGGLSICPDHSTLFLDTIVIAVEKEMHVVHSDILFLTLPKGLQSLWREFVWQCRSWAMESDRIYIVNGLVYSDSGSIVSLYSAVVRQSGNDRSASGFLFPSEPTEKPILQLAVSIDSLERISGIDFFSDLMSSSEQDRIEKTADVLSWGYDVKRYEDRVTQLSNNKKHE